MLEKDLATQLRVARARHDGHTLAEAAAACEVSKESWSRWELGKSYPLAQFWATLIEYTGGMLTVAALVQWQPERPRSPGNGGIHRVSVDVDEVG